MLRAGNAGAQSGALARGRPPAQTVSTGRPAGRFKIETLPLRYLRQSQPLERYYARADGHPALAAYVPDKSARCQAYGIMVFTVAGGGIATITGFPGPYGCGRFGLPATCG